MKNRLIGKIVVLMLSIVGIPVTMTGQTTAVTATVTDSQSVAWANAPYSVTFIGSAPGKPYTTAGQNFTQSYTGSLNSSGQLSIGAVTDVAFIIPTRSTWRFCVTPAVSSPQTYCVNIPVTGASQNVSSQINAVIIPPAVTGGPLATAYADSEVTGVLGNMYARVSDSSFRCYTTSWGTCGTSGPTFAYPIGTGFVTVTGSAAWGTTLADPLGVTHGGTGVNSAPTVNQILLGQSGGTFNLVNISGDEIISNLGVVTVTGLNGNNLAGLGAGILKINAFGIPTTAAIPLTAGNGGTGIDSSASIGVPQVASGVWTISTTLPSGLSATNMTLVTPALGTPASGVLTNATGLPATSVVAGALANGMIATTQGQLDGSTKLATDAYVDLAVSNAVAGVNPAVAVLAASTATLTGTYVQVGGGIGDTFTVTATGAFTLDGIAINTIGQRVLLKNQTTASQNGVYTATIVGATGISPIFTRALDYDTPSDVNNTGTIPVQSGTANSTTSWLLTSQVTSIGSSGSSLTYAQFSLAPSTLVTAASPSAGIARFGGGTQALTSAELSGDATTSGSNAVTLASRYKTWACEPGFGDGLNAITAGTYLQFTCLNNSGSTWTITAIKCLTDNSGTSTLNVTNGSGTGLLTGAVTCTSSFASGTQSGTTTIASGDYMKFTFVADGASKQSTWSVSGTY